MNRASQFFGRFFRLIIILLLVISSHGISNAQNVSWGQSYGRSTIIAKEKNKLILADFWAVWCVPCLKMDKAAWSIDTISSLADNYVCTRFNVSNGWENSEPFFVDQIPTLKIMDYRGEVLLTKEGYADPGELKEILASFPDDVSVLYRGLQNYGRDGKNPTYLLDLASAYQDCARRSAAPAREIFVKESGKFFKKAKSASRKDKDYSSMERIDLLEALNKILSGDFEKGTDIVLEHLDEMGAETEKKNKAETEVENENLSLAYYILIKGFLGQEKQDLAVQFYDKLKTSSGGEDFLKLVRNEFE